MRVPSNLSRGSLGFNMTPMIDVVFLLIIFFLVSSHLAKQETQLEMELAGAASGATPEETNDRRLVVNVLPDEATGEIQVVVTGNVMNTPNLRSMLDFEVEQAKLEKRALEVRIRCDRRVPYHKVEPIMVTCAAAGVWKVTFAVLGE